MTVWEHLESPPSRYRPVPLWSWNDKLDQEELIRQIEEMHRAGIGGFFMHARGGLQTPYMGEEWMEAVRICIEKGRELGMEPWLYDENGWPSGFGDGKIPALGVEYQQKRLAVEYAPFDRGTEGTIALYKRTDQGFHLLDSDELDKADARAYYEVNPCYIDTLSKQAVGAFIREIYDAYWERFGESYGSVIRGVFTDEPQFARRHLPWSFELAAGFEQKFNYSLLAHLPALFIETEGCRKVRYDYWLCVTEMFTEAYAKQIGEWCGSRGWSATGHVVDEQTLMDQVTAVGDPMSFYEYLQIPGCDWLGRFVGKDPVVPKQVSSVARQLGKSRAITESFGCSGWNVSLEELRRIGEWQFVHGINLLCPHLQSYSLQGLRKRDYPPSLFYQQPWWPDYQLFNDYFARLSMLLSEGERQAEVLLLHPARSAWVLQTGTDASATDPYHDAFAQLSRWLCQSLIGHDYGSEFIIERHGEVQGGRFKVGAAAYSVVIVPPSVTVGPALSELLQRFVQEGGTVLAFEPFPRLVGGEPGPEAGKWIAQALKPAWNREALAQHIFRITPQSIGLTDLSGLPFVSDGINVQELELDASTLFYLVNSDEKSYGEVKVRIYRTGKLSLVDLESGEVRPVSWEVMDGGVQVTLPLHAAGSLVIKLDPAKKQQLRVPVKTAGEAVEEAIIRLNEPWMITAAGMNCLTLDTCRFRVENGDWSDPVPMFHVQDHVLQIGRSVQVDLEFEFFSQVSPTGDQPLYLAIENPQQFQMTINGQPLEPAAAGWWMDTSFKKVDIRGLTVQGINRIGLRTTFLHSAEVSRALERAEQFETEGNKLTLETELESIYLLGDFSVQSASPWTFGERRAVLNEGPFFLAEQPVQIYADDLTRQGFPFFAGTVTLGQTVVLPQSDWIRALWQFRQPPDAIVSRLSINGKEIRAFVWEPYEADITPYLQPGENRIELELTGSCRNVLGPHHHIKGEVYKVGPDSFKNTPGWTDKDLDPSTSIYAQRYAFVRFGLSDVPQIVLETLRAL
ncbi:glycosyl hydrolase [Paenibacillus sp. Y412MC10]|uniref:glycosyl hydrolase n=1 Tax=Geobacillus sp. (strain Y412MC10) TaxID=481743 RepID=UPI0011A07364|nr:glycosyl hydrolase [Paenibacillus sp. Y412MC10]